MLTIRPERPADTAAVRAINERAFGQAVEADIVAALRRACQDALSLVAVSEEEVVGHLLFSPAGVQGDAPTILGMGLAPLAVRPEFQRQGIGTRLVEEGLRILREQGCAFVIVLGHPDFYRRFGFVPASRHGLCCQWEGVPDEAFMALVMDAESLAGVTGVARYRHEFDSAM